MATWNCWRMTGIRHQLNHCFRFVGQSYVSPVHVLYFLIWHSLSSIPEFNYTKLSAVRYLAGILERPTFWEKGVDIRKRFDDILIVLCRTILELIQDTEKSKADVDVDLNGDSPLWMSTARDAADILVSATFDGLLRLHHLDRLVFDCPPQLPKIVFLLQRWVHSYIPVNIFWLFRLTRQEMQYAFPKASDRASLVDKIFQQRAETPESHADVPSHLDNSALPSHPVTIPGDHDDVNQLDLRPTIDRILETCPRLAKYFFRPNSWWEA